MIYTFQIDSVKKELFSPRADSLEFEQNAKFWCYFCTSEFDKHSSLDDCTVIGSGLIHHIARLVCVLVSVVFNTVLLPLYGFTR